MKTIHVLGACLAMLGTQATASQFDRSCWDGTFAYNAANLKESGDRLEFSLSGSTLGSLSLRSLGQIYTLDGWSFGSTFHVAFIKDDCLAADGAISCRATSDAILFIEQQIRDLDSAVVPITPFYLGSMDLSWQDDVVELTVMDQGREAQTIGVQRCQTSDVFQPGFPTRLSEYIDRD
ncbi:MAG: hypothetical protein HRU19_27600 [Pseudobacteriovorax sp.]|nr:hypothetical protein [Pseudobacteriovorax sp.]